MKSVDSFRLAIVDYGMGNLGSVQNAFARLGCAAQITNQTKDLENAHALVLPGVGAFGLAMDNLRNLGLIKALNNHALKNKKPILGICLGMQLFADSSEEMGTHEGLGWIPGHVDKIDNRGGSLQVPHVGWNNTAPRAGAPLYRRIAEGAHFYFDHSYYFRCEPKFVMSEVDYGGPIVASVQNENILGVQFHPEKSQVAGLRILKSFLSLAQVHKGNQC